MLSLVEAFMGFFSRIKIFSKTPPPDIVARLESTPPACNALYLRAVLDELRQFGKHEELHAKAADYLSARDPKELYERILARWEHDFGKDLVGQSLSLIWAARHGLYETELADLLGEHGQQLPRARWTPFYLAIENALALRAGLLNLGHSYLRTAVETRFLASDANRKLSHAELASYFSSRADPDRNKTWKGEGARAFMELPFHLVRTNANELADLLFDFNWLQAKTSKTPVYEVLRDYEEALDALRANHPQRTSLILVEDALRLAAHVISDDALQLGAQLLGRLRHPGDVATASLLDKIHQTTAASQLLPLSPSLLPMGELEQGVLCRLPKGCTSLAFTPDNRSIVIGAADGEVSIWDITSHTKRLSLRGHQEAVTALIISHDGKLLISGSGRAHPSHAPESSTKSVEQLAQALPVDLSQLDKVFGDMAPVWKAELLQLSSGKKRAEDETNAMSMQVFKEIMSPGSCDNSVRLWNLELQSEMARFDGHKSAITHVAISRDARFAASASDDHAVLLWDLMQKRMLDQIQGFDEEIIELRFLDDGEDDPSELLLATPSQSRLANIDTGQVIQLGPWTVGMSEQQMNAIEAPWTPQDLTFMGNRSLLKMIDREHALIQQASPNGNYWNLRAEPKMDLDLLFHRAEYRILMSHRAPVRRLALDRNGKRFVSASSDGKIKVCDIDLATGGERGTLPGQFGIPHALAISADGRMAASSGQDGAVRLWNLDAVAPFDPRDKHADFHDIPLAAVPTALAMSHECLFAGVLLDSGTIALIDLPSLRIVKHLSVPQMVVSRLLISKSAGIVLCAGKEGTVACLNSDSGQVAWKASIHSCEISAMAISPDGTLIVSGATDGSIALIDTATGQVLHNTKAHSAAITALMIGSKKDLVVSASDDQRVITWIPSANQSIRHRLINLESNSPDLPWEKAWAVAPLQIRILLAMPTPFAKQQDVKVWDLVHTKLLNPLAFQIAPVVAAAAASDGDFGIVALEDGSLKVWNLESCDLIATNSTGRFRAHALCISPGANLAIVATDEPAVRCWRIGHSVSREQLEHSDDVNAVAYVSKTGQVVSGSYDRTLKVWNAKTRELLHTLSGHKRSVTGVIAVPNKAEIISVSNDGTMVLWDLERFGEIRAFRHAGASCRSAEVLMDGATILSCWDDGKLRLFDLGTGKCLRELPREVPTARAIALYPNQASVFVGCESGGIYQYELLAGKEITCFREKGDPVYCLAVDPKGSCLVSGTAGHSVEIWNVKGRKHEKTLTGHRACVFGVAVDRTGRLIASGADDGRVKLWDRFSGALLGEFTTDHPVYCVTFMEHGEGIVAGNGGGVGTLHFLKVCGV